MIQWFPGHMARGLNEITKLAQVCDLLIIVLDGRAPLATYNETFDTIAPHKPRLIVIAKRDLSDQVKIAQIKDRFNHNLDRVLLLDLHAGGAASQVRRMARKLLASKIARDQARGLKKPQLNLFVLGLPNTGKSTLINMLLGQKRQETANRPGVTMRSRWLTDRDFNVFDTPGILWPKIDDQTVAMKLVTIGAIKHTVIPLPTVFYGGYQLLSQTYPDKVTTLGLKPEVADQNLIYSYLVDWCRQKQFFRKDQVVDVERGMKYFITYLHNLKGVTYD